MMAALSSTINIVTLTREGSQPSRHARETDDLSVEWADYAEFVDRPRWWDVLQGLRPVQRELGREIENALDREFERLNTAHQTTVNELRDANHELEQRLSQLRRDNAVLVGRTAEAERDKADRDRRNAELLRQIERLRARNTELTHANDLLRDQAAELNARRWQKVLVPGTGPVRPRERPRSSDGECDLFHCQVCGSFLLLETPAASEPVLHRPVGEGCGACVDLPYTRPAMAVDVMVPAVAVEANLPVSGTPEEREQVAVELVAGLVKDPPGDVLADAYAKEVVDLAKEWLEQVAPTQPSSLAAVATGLEKVSDTVKTGVVWCATELLGMPDFLGKVLAHVVSDLVTDPLHLKDVCQAIRAVDTAVCTLNGDLGSCASARHLAFTDLGQTVLAEQLKEAIRDPHNDDVLEQLTEAVKDLHENEVLEQLKAALKRAVEDHVADPVLPEKIDPPWRRAFDL